MHRTGTDGAPRRLRRTNAPASAAVTAIAALVGLLLAGCVAPPGPGGGTTTTTAPPRWIPTKGTSFQIQFSGTLDTSVSAEVYDLDGFDTPASTVAGLHSQGRKVVCYLSAGSAEDWRPDFPQFPAAVKGNGLDGWPGETWLDIRDRATLGPIMAARMDLCRDKGFDAVDPDNVDGYTNATGFPLTATDQLAYNRLLADLAHERGLSIGLKNDLDQIPQLVTSFDFAINEQCTEFDECHLLDPFTDAGKAVFQLEYTQPKSAFCPDAVASGRTAMRKNLSLNAFRDPS